MCILLSLMATRVVNIRDIMKFSPFKNTRLFLTRNPIVSVDFMQSVFLTKFNNNFLSHTHPGDSVSLSFFRKQFC